MSNLTIFSDGLKPPTSIGIYIFTYIFMVDFYGIKCINVGTYTSHMYPMGMLLHQFVSSTYHVKYLFRDKSDSKKNCSLM